MTKIIAKKRFGQNFLQDQYIIEQIIKTINPKKDDVIVEIGPGRGALTKPLIDYVDKLHVIEIDRDLIQYIKNTFGDRLVLHEGDALKFDYNEITADKIRVVGNLPYNISTPILFYLSQFDHISDMHFMLQKEVVDRICAKPNTSAYGRLSVMLQYKFNCYKVLDVSKECFYPKPQVESAIVRLTPKDKNLWQNVNEKQLNHVVTRAFSQRRKTISNSLKQVFSLDDLVRCNIDKNKRAENLTVADYLNLNYVLKVMPNS